MTLKARVSGLSDSAVAVGTFNAMNEGRLGLDRKPWGLRIARDMREQRGGQGTTVISKVKAHCTFDHVRAGLIERHHLVGNSKADTIAKLGVMWGRPAVEEFGKWLVCHEKIYETF
eukprot:997493-Alexandrium_andersonii.AAC.1